MRSLNAVQTATALPYRQLVASLRAVLADDAAGLITSPVRASLPLPNGGLLLVMPAVDQHLAMVKTVAAVPANAGAGLPAVQGEELVIDAINGRPLLRLDGAAVTARRTAAVSLLAALTLAPVPSGPMFLLGAGVQARAHL